MPSHYLIFRMIHIDGLESVLRNGIWSKSSGVIDQSFVPIGNQGIISKREHFCVGINPPGGVLGEYIPFYFHGHSPMLFNIITGYGVNQLKQEDIIFIVCDAEQIMQSSLEWCFTDGHAMKMITKYYNKAENLGKLDWKAISATIWKDSEEDPDRQRKKMSEFLIKRHVPVEMIRSIVVHSDIAKAKVEQLLQTVGKSIPVHVDAENHLYYKDYD